MTKKYKTKIMISLGTITISSMPVLAMTSCFSKEAIDENTTIVKLDFTTQTSGVISSYKMYNHFLDTNYNLSTDEYIFKLKAHASANIQSLDFQFTKDDLEEVRSAEHNATPMYPSINMTLNEFTELMKQATGSSLTLKPQFSISTETEKKLGLTLTSSIDVDFAKNFFMEKFIGEFPNGIDYADVDNGKPFTPNSITNNMDVWFKDANDNIDKSQFNMKVIARNNGETDSDYESRIDQINVDASKGSKFTEVIDAAVQEFKDYSAKLIKFLDKIKNSNVDGRDVARYIIASFTKYIVDKFTTLIPIYGQISKLPYVGTMLNRKLNDYLLGNYIDKIATFVVDKIYP